MSRRGYAENLNLEVIFMKALLNNFIIFASLLYSGIYCQAQSSNNNVTVPPSTPYSIVARDANSRVWESTSYELSPSGEVIPHLNHYTELATGLCYRQNDQWLDSQELINILSDGTACATNGQHQVYFPPDIYNGVITLVTSDGLQLKSQPLGLSYDDATNAVLFAVLTNSVGQLISSNQVIYTNAFVGVDADLLYTYRKSGFEQDVIFREQPPTPEQFGLNSANTCLQMLTEFPNPPSLTESVGSVNPQDGMQDATLNFGAMRMGQGKAFLMNTSDAQDDLDEIPVYKSLATIDGRTLLIEQLPYQQIRPQLTTLPSLSANTVSKVNSVLRQGKLQLPPARLVAASTNSMKLARADVIQKAGVIFDYITIIANETNYTFQGDTTYYVSGEYYLYGETVFEGGTIIKMNSSGKLDVDLNGTVDCQTGPYQPAVFTSFNDNAIGDAFGSGSPAMGDVSTFLNLNATNVFLYDMRFDYCLKGVNQINPGSAGSVDLLDCQFKNVDTAVYAYNVGLYNVLIGRNIYTNAAVVLKGASLVGENVTADYGSAFIEADLTGASVALTNCLVTSQPLLTSGSSVTLSTNGVVCLPLPSAPIYQVVGGGNYYLTNGSPYRSDGTTNISPVLLADLLQKTTWPPVVYSNITISVSTNLSPQALRDTNSFPDVGYHYDPIDYIIGETTLAANDTINLAAGTTVGWFRQNSSGTEGLLLSNGSQFDSTGTANNPCRFFPFNSVQEGNGIWPWSSGWGVGIMFDGSSSTSPPQINGQFTIYSRLSDTDGGTFRDVPAYGQGTFKDCEFYNDSVATYKMQYLYYTNCLFFRNFLAFWDQNYALSFNFENCTFYNGCLFMGRTSGNGGYSSSFWQIENTSFDGTAFAWTDNHNGGSGNTLFNYNAYNTNNSSWKTYPYPYPPATNHLEVVGANDLAVTNYNWQTSWFGNFYLPANSPLIEMGSTNASLLGLYHFTTQTNQTPEGTNIVDIGYHYVATDQYGNPLDSNGDGIPDYLEDPAGNGSGNWDTTLLLNVIITQPQNGSTLP